MNALLFPPGAYGGDRTSSDSGCSVARLGRYFLPGQPLHVIQRGNNHGATVV
jgi:hypothetical protein